MRHKPLLYVAAPLFSQAELSFNVEIKVRMGRWFDVYLPQEDGGLLTEMISGGMPPAQAAERVFELDLLALRNCDWILILLDGRAIDEGAAFELGFALALGKRCIALQTDSRRLNVYGNNPMIAGAVELVLPSLEELDRWAAVLFTNTEKAVLAFPPLTFHARANHSRRG